MKSREAIERLLALATEPRRRGCVAAAITAEAERDPETCSLCEGSGQDPDAPMCETCDGEGYYVKSQQIGNERWTRGEWVRCGDCMGVGVEPEHDCPRCEGEGVL